MNASSLRLFLPLAAAAALLAVPALAADGDYRTPLGEVLPALELQAVGGEALAFPADGAKAHVVHLFACESALCGEALGAIEAGLWAHVKDKPVSLVAIARDASDEEAAALARERAITFPVVADPDRTLAGQLVEGGKGVPRTIITDAEGRVVWRHDGFRPGREVEFRAVVEALLNDDPIPAALAPGREAGASAMAGGGSFVGKPLPEPAVEQWINPAPDTAGKHVMLEFWATWCPPCRVAMPHLEQVHKSHGDRLAIISISSEDAATVRAFVEKHGYTYPLAVDTQGRQPRGSDRLGGQPPGGPQRRGASGPGAFGRGGFPSLTAGSGWGLVGLSIR